MSAADKTTDRTIMFVSDADDAEVRACVGTLQEAGASVVWVPDVYAATAKLALGDQIARVFLDVRSLDERELGFMRLLRRFFPGCAIVIPLFEGAAGRLAAIGPGVGVSVGIAVDSAISELGLAPRAGHPPGAHLAPAQPLRNEVTAKQISDEARCDAEFAFPPQAEVVRHGESRAIEASGPILGEAVAKPSPVPSTGLSTDGGTENFGGRPPLHEAVRRRMAEGEVGAPRRTPPQAPPGKPALDIGQGRSQGPVASPQTAQQPQHEQGPTPSDRPSPFGSMLSPEEMDALLTDDEVETGEIPPPGAAGGPS